MEEGHSLDHGHKTDIVSGRPVEEDQKPKEKERLVNLQERRVKHEAVLEDLRSGQGRLAIEKIHQALDRRVLELIEKDETARALMSILESFAAEIVATRAIREQVEKLQRSIDRS